jgi:hypothetical protein
MTMVIVIGLTCPYAFLLQGTKNSPIMVRCVFQSACLNLTLPKKKCLGIRRPVKKQDYNILYILGFWFSALKRNSYLIALLFHCFSTPFPAITEPFTISWVENFYSLLISVRVLCYQPSCHNCFRLAILFKFLISKPLLVCWKQRIIGRQRIPLT